MLRAEHLDQFAQELAGLEEASTILDALHAFVHPVINVLAAWRPRVYPSGERLSVGKNVFFHSKVPPAFRDEFIPLAGKNGPSQMARLAFQRQKLITWSEGMRILELRGEEAWFFDLARRHGMRDGAYSPSGPWMIAYWSRHALRGRYKLENKIRACLFMAGGFAAHREEEIIDVEKIDGRAPKLTAPQQAVLRLLSHGFTQGEIAKKLKRSSATVNDHFEAARAKLGARNSHHAAMIAMRLHLLS